MAVSNVNYLILCFLAVLFPLSKGICNDYPVFKQCECKTMTYLGREQFVLNCTDIGFTNVSILSNLPEETEVLLFVGNNIPDLPWNVFGTDKNLTKLRVIDMSRNNIRIILGKSFHHVSNVERLLLNNNQITITTDVPQLHVHHPRIFSNFEHLLELHLSNAFADKGESLTSDLHDILVHSELKTLRKIHLEQNDLTGFKEPMIFCELPNIMDLYLGDNKLNNIDFNIDCLPHLRLIDLENNHISVVGTSDMEKLTKAAKSGLNITLDMSGNPLLCGPQLEAFYSLLDCSKIQLRNKDKLKCKKESDEDKMCNVVINPISCSDIHKSLGISEPSHYDSHALLIIALIVSLLTNAFFFYRRIWPSDPIGNWFRSFSQAFTSSAVHYTKQSNLDDL